MSTDNTELTFVRCPACRSLVPAVSTRCRMCGATLDAAAQKVDEPPRDSPKSGRVRQRTTSVSGSDLSAAAGLIRQEMGAEIGSSGDEGSALAAGGVESLGEEPVALEASASSTPSEAAPEPSFFSGAASSTSGGQDDDPLSAYIQEVEVEEPATNGASAHRDEPASRAPKAAEKAAEPSASAARPSEVKPVDARPSDTAEKRPSEQRPSEQPRVIIETGPRKSNKPSNLSFGAGRAREEEPKQAAGAPEEAGWQQVPSPRDGGARDKQARSGGTPANQPSRDTRPEAGRGEQQRGQQQGQQGLRGDSRSERPGSSQQPGRRPEQREGSVQRDGGQRDSGQRDSGQRDSGQRDSGQREGGQRDAGQRDSASPRDSGQRPARELRPSQSEVEFSQAQTGRLVGWLVSYSDVRGSASELREGRFFFTAAPLKPHDVVLDDPSISTPHALVAVGVGEGLRVQDLMSDRGVWVKRKGQDGFQRISDAVKIEHGDWLRLGEVEFMVCLIAAPGAK